MKPIEGWESINEAGEFKRLPAGIYGAKITNIVNNAEREYFEIYCDVVKGEFANYFKLLVENGLKDTSRTIRSYKQSALVFFKGFITAVEKSNPGYQWDWDENKLIGKNVIAVFGEEEYIDGDGNVKTNVKIQEFRSLEAWQKGEIKVPEIKKVTEQDWAKWREAHPMASQGTEVAPGVVGNNLPLINPDDLPF